MTQSQQHIDDFFRSSEAAYTPDVSLQDAHWQQFQLQMNTPPPAPSSGIGSWMKLLGGLAITGTVIILAARLLTTHPATLPVVSPAKAKDTIPARAAVRSIPAKERKATDTVHPPVQARAAHKVFINEKKVQPPRQRILVSKDTAQHAVRSVTDHAVRDTVTTRQLKDTVRRLNNEHSYHITDSIQLQQAAELKVVPATINLSAKPVDLVHNPVKINSHPTLIETTAPATETTPGRVRIRNTAKPTRTRAHKKIFVYNTDLLIFLIQP
ncbi:MAG: hypothetical protein QM731_14940 [Chitinophagaceae bacterium]